MNQKTVILIILLIIIAASIYYLNSQKASFDSNEEIEIVADKQVQEQSAEVAETEAQASGYIPDENAVNRKKSL